MTLSDTFSRVLSITGVIFLGVGAGVRYSQAQIEGHITCTPNKFYTPEACQALYAQLAADTTTFLVGGLMVLASGAFVQYALHKRRQKSDPTEAD